MPATVIHRMEDGTWLSNQDDLDVLWHPGIVPPPDSPLRCAAQVAPVHPNPLVEGVCVPAVDSFNWNWYQF